MSILEILRKRRSIRKYQAKPIENEKLNNILEAARLGPSAGNMQPCQLMVITKPEERESLKRAYNSDWFSKAPVIVAVCANPKEAWKRRDGEEFWKVDAAIAMQNMILAATELGLGTCWVVNFDEKEARKALNVPKDFKVAAMTPLGYPDEELGPVTDRKPLNSILHFEKW